MNKKEGNAKEWNTKEQVEMFEQLKKLQNKGGSSRSKEYRALRNKLVIQHIGLAVWVAVDLQKYYEELGLEYEDIRQYALQYLIQAVETYDVSKGYTFSTYAVPVIEHGITRSWIREEKSNQEIQSVRLRKLRKTKIQYEEQFGGELSDLEFFKLETVQLEQNGEKLDIAEDILNMEGDLAKKTFEKYIQFMSMESVEELIENGEISENFDNENIPFFEDMRSVEKTVIKNELRKSIEEDTMQAVKILEPDEQEELMLRYGIAGNKEHDWRQISEKVGKSHEGIRKRSSRLLKKIRQEQDDLHIKEYRDENLYEYDDEYIISDEHKDEIVDGIKIESVKRGVKKKTRQSRKEDGDRDL